MQVRNIIEQLASFDKLIQILYPPGSQQWLISKACQKVSHETEIVCRMQTLISSKLMFSQDSPAHHRHDSDTVKT